MRNCRLAIVGVLLTGMLAAQDYRGSLLGRVRDSTGTVVPGAGIIVVNEATNVATTTRTNDEGNYLAPLLEPVTYTITAEAAGFKKLVRSGIIVRTGDKLTLDLQLELGATSESVTVTGEATLLTTNSADIAQVIDRRFLDLLYVSNRNPLSLISLTPGVLGGGILGAAGGG